MTSKTIYREEIIFSLITTAQVSKKSEDLYLWEQKSEVNNRHNGKLFNLVENILARQLSKNHKDYISYHIVDFFGVETMLIERRLVIRYMPDSDFDVQSIVDEAKRVVKNAFKSVEKVVRMTKGHVHEAKIVLHNQVCTINTESKYIIVYSELEKRLVETIFTGISVSARDSVILKIKIDSEEVVMSIPASDRSSFVTDKRKFEIGRITCVDDDDMCASLLNEHGHKKKELYFDESLRDELLEAQSCRSVLEIEVTPTEKPYFGERVEIGGRITGLRKMYDDKLI